MRHFSATELSRMQATQFAHMMDSGQRLAYASTPDRYGNPEVTYTAGAETYCGFDPTGEDEVQDSGQVVIADAAIRLPIATVIDSRDRWRMTKRFGVAITPEDYEIVGVPARGPSGLVIMVRKIGEAVAVVVADDYLLDFSDEDNSFYLAWW